jgi:hypothetical protein
MAVQERITVQWRVVVPANLAVQPGSEPTLRPADVVGVRMRQSMPRRAAAEGWPGWFAPAGHPLAAQMTV